MHSLGAGPAFRRATALAPATCGELVQGVLGNRDFLINSPIDLYSQVGVEAGAGDGIVIRSPGDYSKVAAAARAALSQNPIPIPGIVVDIHSQVPRGKGLASSTSEIAATVLAVAEATGVDIPAQSVSNIAVSVEPSDGVYFPGVVMYDHLRGDLLDVFGSPPPLAFLIVDCGGEVDTVTFDRQRARANAATHEKDIRRAVELVSRGFRLQSAELIAEGATLSARVNQKVLYKPQFESLLEAVRSVGALGINCAHSGTVLGVIFDPDSPARSEIRRVVTQRMGEENIIGVHRLIGGGMRVLERDGNS